MVDAFCQHMLSVRFSYHVCPSQQNFQFDTSFMFIIAVLNLIKIYQTRHADINPHSARTFSFLALIIFITVVGVVRRLIQLIHHSYLSIF